LSLCVARLPIGPLETNCYVLTDTENAELSVVIDPAYPDEALSQAIAPYTVSDILITHAHFDHIGGLSWLVAQTKARVWLHQAEEGWLQNPILNLSALFSTTGELISSPPATNVLQGDDSFSVLGQKVFAYHTPGHTPGHMVYRIGDDVFTGDLIFNTGVGRTDLPGGSSTAMNESLKRTILTLPDNVRLWPGHGAATTVGTEREHNPYLTSL
jgi:hydroxyacylglutathione hydrolase